MSDIAGDPFASVPEQPEAKRLLLAALADGDAHAFLFHGPPGVGKTDRRDGVGERTARGREARAAESTSGPAGDRAAR